MNTLQLNRSDIERILPHRTPLLLADSAVLGSQTVQTVFYVDPDMDIFKGHFPDDPVLPGVYITESLAQCADILLLSMPGNAGLKPLLASIGGMRFFRPVRPGDTLICEAELDTSSPEMSTYECRTCAFISGSPDGEKLKAAQGHITLCLK